MTTESFSLIVSDENGSWNSFHKLSVIDGDSYAQYTPIHFKHENFNFQVFLFQIVNNNFVCPSFEFQWNISSIANIIWSYDGNFFKSFDLMSHKHIGIVSFIFIIWRALFFNNEF